MNFKDKVVFIPGAGAGIGRVTAVMFAQHGAKVIINALGSKRGTETLYLVRSEGVEGIFVQGDVSVEEDVVRILGQALDKFSRIDILVNNAGIVIPGRVDNSSLEDFQKMMAVNVQGTFLTSKYVIKEMKKQGGGTIVNVASVAGLKGHKDRALYSASKGAIVALTKSMATDYVKDNIRVNCVCPGTTLTPALEEKIRNAEDPKAMEDAFVSRQPMGRLGKPEEIAYSILFACSEEVAFMNGSIITIDGGMTM
jgi:meso-butanediol dehydrogenase / (S,S)-butanediol dehydrogenase / diacetyl reductase